ncbi:glycosyltransferase family 2 protein, partial [Dyella sp.]|uniref:glycosyltransferase family 2 protein n=1 Tax=Dyella sp. TaxID=1869338 RepID=UPI002B898E4C
MSAVDATSPVISIIVVSADSGPMLRECIYGVLGFSVPLEVLLIDNGSNDGIPQAIGRGRESDPRLKIIYNHKNLGFGPAVNRAAAQATGQTLLILNPDCMIKESELQRLLEILSKEPKAGVIGAVVCDERGVPDPASYRRDPVLQRALTTLFKRNDEGVNISGPMPDHVVDAEAVSGALMLMPRRVF